MKVSNAILTRQRKSFNGRGHSGGSKLLKDAELAG